jgi:peptide deformylase
VAIRPIVTLPEPRLRRRTEAVPKVDDDVRAVIADLADTLFATTGVGLAAPQIGVPWSVLIAAPHRDHEVDERDYYAMVNPRVVHAEGSIVSRAEGCKSVPGLRVDVPRSERVVVEGLDADGRPVRREATGWEAIVLQHEIDHLEGALLVDRALPATTDAARIKARLERFRSLPDGVLVSQRTRTEHVLVVKRGEQIVLYFGNPREDTSQMRLSGIMSRVSIDDPLNLLGLYTRVMLLALAWCPEPARVYVVGFGGGRIPMVLHHHLPAVVIDSTETEAFVVRLAQQYFGIELDDRMRVAVEDGRAFLERREPYDVILVDCFSADGHHPYRLSTAEFYELCRGRLRPGGVVATNLSSADPLVSEKIATFASAFRTSLAYRTEEACVLFGTDGDEMDLESAVPRATRLADRHRFAFPLAEYAVDLTAVRPALGVSPLRDAAASQVLTADDPLFLGVGRNDPCPCGSGKKFKRCHGAAGA